MADQLPQVTLIGRSLIIEIAEGAGGPRMREVAPNIWMERDGEGTLTKIELLVPVSLTIRSAVPDEN